MGRNLLSAIILVVTAVAAIIAYIVLFATVDRVFGSTAGIIYFSLITFLAAIGVFISAILIERNN